MISWSQSHLDRLVDWILAATIIFFAYRVERNTSRLQQPRPIFAFPPAQALGADELRAQVWNVGGAALVYFTLVHFRRHIFLLKSHLPAQAPQSHPVPFQLQYTVDNEAPSPEIVALVALDPHGVWWNCLTSRTVNSRIQDTIGELGRRLSGQPTDLRFTKAVADVVNNGLPADISPIFFVRPKADGNIELVKWTAG